MEPVQTPRSRREGVVRTGASWFASLRCKKANEIIELRSRKSGPIGRHGRFASKFLQTAQLALAETVKAALLVLELNGESVFIEADAADGLATVGSCFHQEEIFRDGFCRILQSLAEARRPAADTDVGKLRAVACSFSVQDVAGRAAAVRVDRFSACGIARKNFGRDISEAANVRSNAGDFFFCQKPSSGHFRGNA